MARLSGMASHSQGSGEPSRRKKSRKSKATSLGPLSSPVKRPASPSPDTASTKRVKHVQVDVEESVSLSQPVDTIRLVSSSVERNHRRFSEPPTTHDELHDDLHDELHDDQPEPAPASRAFKAARRARMSMPANLRISALDGVGQGNEVQFAPIHQVLDRHSRLRLRRNHLSEEMNDIEERKKRDIKLRKAYLELTRQLQEREARISELESQLEESRLGHIDLSKAQTEDIRRQLEAAQKEIEDLRNSTMYAPESASLTHADSYGSDDDDEDMNQGLMLVDPDELAIPEEKLQASPIPNGIFASRAVESSQITIDSLSSLLETTRDSLAHSSQTSVSVGVPDKISDKAVQRYESEIEFYVRRAADAEGGLRCMTIEMQNLGIIKPGSTASEILTALRHTLEDLREEYEKIFPRSTAGLTGAEFLRKLVEDIKGMNAELLEKTLLSEKLNQKNTILQVQYETLLRLLADESDRNAELEGDLKQLQEANAEQERQIQEQEDQIAQHVEEEAQQRGQLEEKEATIHGLTDELEDKETTIQRLISAMEEYREEAENLTATIQSLEAAHAERIVSLETEHDEVVTTLEARYSEEAAARTEAEEVIVEKDQEIDALEERIDDLTNKFSSVSEQAEDLGQRLDQEIAARADAEQQRDENAETAYERANTIENLRENIAEFEQELADLRTNLSAERAQREQTESDLAEANNEIEAKESQLHNLGVQANELRSKLFQVQQEREASIAELKQESEARENELNNSLEAETERRQLAEQEVADLTSQISDIETQLARLEQERQELETARSNLEADRDQQVEMLSAQLDELAQRYTALEARSKVEIDALQATVTDLTNERNALNALVRRQEESAQETAKIREEQITEREDVIAGLERDLFAEQEKVTNLERKNQSLEERVTSEAMELLNMENAHREKVEELNRTIHEQKTAIEEMVTKMEQRAQEHADLVAEKERQIEELQLVGAQRAEMIALLQSNVEELKDRFRLQTEDSENTINALLDTNRRAIAQQEKLAAETKKRTYEALQAVAEMKVKGLEVRTTGGDLKKVASGKITKVNDKTKIGKKKRGGLFGRGEFRPRDSGFVDDFVDPEEEMDELEDEDEGLMA